VKASATRIAEAIRLFLERGGTVNLEGVGLFRKSASGELEFLDEARPRVFLAYAAEDGESVERLYDALEALGFAPWMDRRKLLPGQRWKPAILHAIQTSSCFIACFSSRSVHKRGGFQAELRFALECAREVPLGDIFLIPARLSPCEVPEEIRRDLQYVDLFPKFDPGVRRIAAAIRAQEKRRRKDAA